jgi:hypothetical protein
MEIVIMEFLEITKQLQIALIKEIDNLDDMLGREDCDMTDISVINEEIKSLKEMLRYNEWGNMFDYLHWVQHMDRLKENDKQYEKDCLGFEPKSWIA